MFPCPTWPLARQSGLWQNWLCGFIAGLLSTRSCTHRQITSGKMPEGPAFFQAIRRLATVNWGGTQCVKCMLILEFISIYDMLCLPRKEATAMGNLRCTDLQTRPLEVLDLTSLNLEEFRH